MSKEATTFDTLEEFVKNNLTAAQFERLHEMLGITKNAVTSMLRNPKVSATLDNVQSLAKFCGCTPKHLVQRYQMGVTIISIDQAKEIGFTLS